jgi:hypothetical protein
MAVNEQEPLPPGYTWSARDGGVAAEPQPAFHEAGGGCMANDPAYYSVSAWAPADRVRARRVVMGVGGSEAEAIGRAIQNAWNDFHDPGAAGKARLRRLVDAAVADDYVDGYDLPEILKLIADILIPVPETPDPKGTP